MLVTGCASSQMQHLELQTKPSLSELCVNNDPNFSELTYTTSIDQYMSPKGMFSDSMLSDDQSEREQNDIYEEARSLGKRVGEYDAEKSFWDMGLKPVASQMDVIFNYRSIMYGSLVLPKRLVIVEGGVEKKDNFLFEKGYTVLVEDEFETLTSEPSWKNFFHIPSKPPRDQNLRAFDMTQANINTWRVGLKDGYFEGVCLALYDYKQAMENVGADFSERYLYVVAERRGLTKKPKIQSLKIPYEVNGSSLDLDTKVYKVEDEGEFNNKSQWGGL